MVSWVLPELLEQARRPEFSWSVLRPGVDEHRLWGNHDDRAPTSSILRYAPGAHIPYHRHDGYEYVYVLSGSQRDERGTYGPGTLVVNAPGSTHDVASDDGCIVLLIWERPVVFVER